VAALFDRLDQPLGGVDFPLENSCPESPSCWPNGDDSTADPFDGAAVIDDLIAATRFSR
jgi:hypothetical protein